MDLAQLVQTFWPLLSELEHALRLLKKAYSKLDVDDRKWLRDHWIDIFDIDMTVQEQYTSVRNWYADKPLEELKDLVISIKTEIDLFRHARAQLDDLSDSESADSKSDDPGSPTKRLKVAEDDDRSTKKGDRLERQPRTTRKVRILQRPATNTNCRPLLCKGVDESNQTPRILPDDSNTRNNAWAFLRNGAFSNSGQEERQGSRRRPRGMVARIIEKNQKKAYMDQEMKDT
ncbi:uncharacterized protein FTOL_01319 [Fusarium torulosum]|uniref:Uncharacterized protein n=1 Tax=Fusarium torulosum TaxID=33205 RepID=A0AAE8LZR6_9HYPO|nr:uncharacterized protein FTOL_01319 [Fusarium torulosum]